MLKEGLALNPGEDFDELLLQAMNEFGDNITQEQFWQWVAKNGHGMIVVYEDHST
jgi:hypothetical protein